jgi:hypothetical protein
MELRIAGAILGGLRAPERRGMIEGDEGNRIRRTMYYYCG